MANDQRYSIDYTTRVYKMRLTHHRTGDLEEALTLAREMVSDGENNVKVWDNDTGKEVPL